VELSLFVMALVVVYLLPGPDMILLLETGARQGKTLPLLLRWAGYGPLFSCSFVGRWVLGAVRFVHPVQVSVMVRLQTKFLARLSPQCATVSASIMILHHHIASVSARSSACNPIQLLSHNAAIVERCKIWHV
jgi:hypothetical protein